MSTFFDIENEPPQPPTRNKLQLLLDSEGDKAEREEQRHSEMMNALQQLIMRSGGTSHSGGTS